MQALESARCIEEKVVTDMREADVGSILGFGFAPFTGGTISYIDGMGAKAFVELCNTLARTCGDRFKPLQAFARYGEEERDVLRPLRTRKAQGRRIAFMTVPHCPPALAAYKVAANLPGTFHGA